MGGSYTKISEGGKTIENTDWGHSPTARAAGWVSSSGTGSGTVTRLDDGYSNMNVGVILRGQRDLDRHMLRSGTSWFYHSDDGSICKSEAPNTQDQVSTLQKGLARINLKKGDKVTVVVKKGKLSFAVNGAAQGTPIDLPVNTLQTRRETGMVAMAVSLMTPLPKVSLT